MGSISDWFRSWRLVSWRSAIVAAIVLYALIGFLVVPWIVKNLIEKKSVELVKRQATVEKVRCNPFALSLTIEGFSIPDRPGSVLLSWDRLYANAQVSSLFRWAATLKELTIENPYVALRRFEDGSVNVLEVMEDLPEPEPKPPEDEGGLPRALLQHVQVVDGRVDLEDRYNRPEALVWELGPSQVELLNISTIPEHEGTNDLVLGLMGGGELRANGRVVVEPLGLDGTFNLKSVQIANTWRAVGHLFEFDLTGGVLDLDVEYQISLEDDGIHLVANDADIRIAGFNFQAQEHDADLLQVDNISISGGHLEWPEQNVAAESVLIEGATAFGWIEPDGTPNWDVLIPEESQEQIVETYQTLEERIEASAELGRFELRDAGAQFENRIESPPMLFEITDANLVVTDISTKEGSVWPFDASAKLEGEALGTAKGTFGAAPLAAEVEVSLEGLELAKYQPFVAKIAPLEVRAGVLHAGGTATASKPKGPEPLEANFKGEFGVIGLDLNETVTGDKLLGWGDLEVKGIDADLQPMGAMVTEVDIYSAGLQVTVAEDGSINLLEFLGAMTEGEEGSADSGAAAATEGLPPLVIARFRLHDCYGVYTDKTPSSGSFQMALKPINGTITGISTTSKAGAKLDIDAGIDVGGGVRVEGELDPLDYQRLTDLSIDVRDMQLPAVSPMSVKFIGHPITDGDVSLDLDYDIVDRYLTAFNLIEADDLELGDKVEGEGMINLPFKLGVSLLKDKEGRITLEVPFEGSFDDPGFGMASAAGSAAKEIFTELVKSPFKMLGKIGGGGGDQDLEFVEFAGGDTALEEGARRNLDTLASALAERPSLALTINGTYDPEVDRPGLQAAALREELLAQGVTEEEFDTIIPLEKLESPYSSRHSAAELDALRAQHTSAGTAEGAEPVLDEVAYRDALRESLVASQPIDDAALQALAPARAEAIRAYLVDQGGFDAVRVSVAPEAVMVEPDAKETAATESENWVRCQLELAAE
jgi:hypothetical protein